MASIVKRGKSWFVQVRRQGVPTYRKTFKTKKAAQDWAAQIEGRAVEGTLPSREAQRHTFADMVERFEREGRCNPNYKTHLKWFKARIGDRKLSAITVADLNELKINLAQGRAPATVNRYLSSLSAIYSCAADEWEWLEYSPMRKVKNLKEPRGRVRFLSEDERTALLGACQADMDRFTYPFVVLALSTGARAGELQRLTWKDMDLVNGRGVLHNTKNGDRRAIAIKGHALDEIKKLSKVRRIDSPWVFPSPEGTEPWNYRHAWYRVLDAAQLKDFRFHDLRHTAASYLAMNGASLPEIAGVLGHKTLAMVQRYTHLSDEHISGAVESMNAKIFGDNASESVEGEAS